MSKPPMRPAGISPGSRPSPCRSTIRASTALCFVSFAPGCSPAGAKPCCWSSTCLRLRSLPARYSGECYNGAMPTLILATKLYVPPPAPAVVPRPRLIERLDEGLRRRLTLLSAPAGFGKTTLVSTWVAGCNRPVAWLSLDEGDSDPTRFLTYLVAALQSIAPAIGAGLLSVLQSPQPPPSETVLTALLNDISTTPQQFVLVLDDYHVIDDTAVDEALTFLLEHLPAQLHLVITTREDPQLPLARLRVRSQLTELRATDLRFTPAEAATFLNQVMGLGLAAADVSALETRTEGWIAGLQMAEIGR